jgi:hypothetical protein
MLHRTAKSRPVALKYRPSSCIGLPPRQAGKPAPPRSAVRGLRSPFVYSFTHSLTACLSTGWKACSPAVCRPRSAVSIRLFVPPFVDGLPPRQAKACPTRSAIRGLRSPFVYSFPHSLTVCLPDRLESLSYAVCRLRSPFVYSFPHSLTVCLSTDWKACSLAVCRPPSAVSFCRPRSLLADFGMDQV